MNIQARRLQISDNEYVIFKMDKGKYMLIEKLIFQCEKILKRKKTVFFATFKNRV